MDSTDEDIFTTAPSQYYYPGLHNEIQIEEGLQEACAAVNKVVELNNAMEILGAKPFGAQPAGPSCSATQVEPRVFAWEIQLHLAAAQEALSRAKEKLESKWELRHVSKTRRIVQRVSNTEIEKLATALNKVSLAKADTRLVIAYHQEPDENSHLPSETLEVSGVIQTKENVDYSFKVPRLGHEIKIVYKPTSDDCLLVFGEINDKADIGTDVISIANLSTLKTPLEYLAQPAIWGALMPSQTMEIQPGIWRILVGSSRQEYPSTIDILVLKRPYNVSIQDTNDMPTKRQATDHIERTRSAKRRRLRTLGTNGEAAKALDFDNDDHTTQMSQNSVTLQDLQKGNTITIETQANRKETYSLHINSKLGRSQSALVFSCRHSKAPIRMIAAKILRPKRDPIANANCWKREKTALEKLNHENIVELKSFDARTHFIGLELLPPSLRVILDDENHPSYRSFLQPSEALRIIQDLSSALAYLSTKDIVHNDIKPDNIAYSPDRGPVLLDFGMAISSSAKTVGGTPWYIPPEYLINGSRGFAGDMWALGITMIYILGHIPLPETTGEPWRISKSREGGADRDKMKFWLGRIDSKRKELCLQERPSAVGLAAAHSLALWLKRAISAGLVAVKEMKLSKAFKHRPLDPIPEEEEEEEHHTLDPTPDHRTLDPIPEEEEEEEHHTLDPTPDHRTLDPMPQDEGEEFYQKYSVRELEEVRQKMGTRRKERRMS
ncbi:hypothetical protein MKX08_006545 [Trichoderma sp. CBMAI-0020]|nr:hypothetical protein MKX08_006545 [Trichoderma sp. CBMAI-0020]WOD46112.1 hypothetical protein [Trichoderma atroviride]